MNKGIIKYKKQQDVLEEMESLDVLKEIEASEEDAEVVSIIESVETDEEVDIVTLTSIESDDSISTEVEVEIKKEEVRKVIVRPPGTKEVLGTREQIIIEYAPLIKYIAQKIAARLPANIDIDDLISSGVIGLMDAIEKYDPTRDNKFKTYAEFRIRGAILDELRAQDWVPRSVREKAKMLERAFAKVEQEKGRAATEEEVCAELKISTDEYYDLLNQVRSISLLSYEDLHNFARGDRRNDLGYGAAGRAATPFSELNVAHIKKLVSDAIKELPEKQRLVLSLYYYEDLNLKEIGKVLDVTESRVSQLHTQAILRLRMKLKNHFDDFLMLFN